MTRTRTPWIDRRSVLAGATAVGAAALAPSRIFGGQPSLVRTPRQIAGPFYPEDWLGDSDNDLVLVTGEAAKAMGQVVHVRGRLLHVSGGTVADALIEIWQCGTNGVYRHSRDMDDGRPRDGGFQGRGRTKTDAAGNYAFRTIRPVPYPGRTPHIHFKVERPSGEALVTQMYVAGEPLNARDGLLNAIRDQRQRDSVIVKLDPAESIEPGALAGTFDIVVG